jgi:hypothetical protein
LDGRNIRAPVKMRLPATDTADLFGEAWCLTSWKALGRTYKHNDTVYEKKQKEGQRREFDLTEFCQKMGRTQKEGLDGWDGMDGGKEFSTFFSSLASLIAIERVTVAICHCPKRRVKPGQLILTFPQIGALRGRDHPVSRCSTVYFSLIRSLSLTI